MGYGEEIFFKLINKYCFHCMDSWVVLNIQLRNFVCGTPWFRSTMQKKNDCVKCLGKSEERNPCRNDHEIGKHTFKYLSAGPR